MEKKCIVQVAPLVSLPRSRTQIFSYWHENQIPAGSLVEIPFRFRIMRGIVLAGSPESGKIGRMHFKKIRKISEKTLLLEQQIHLAKKISEYYIAPLGIVLKLMIPRKTKARKKITDEKSSLKENIAENREAQAILESSQKIFLVVGNLRQRKKIILRLAAEMLGKGQQCLFLVSEILGAEALFLALGRHFPQNAIALLHSDLSRGEYFRNWEKVRYGTAKIIVATKIGVFLPFVRLGMVAVIESQDISFKQWDRSPRYHATRAAGFLAEIHSAKLVFSNSAYSAELYRGKKDGEVRLIKLQAGDRRKQFKIINSFAEKKNPDFPLAGELQKELSQALNVQKKILVIVNRKGFSSFSVCQKCKKVLRCPHCERALVYFEEAGKYQCLHCSHKTDLLSTCPACGAHQFSHHGIGLQLTEKKLKRLYPSARIAKVYEDRYASAKKRPELLAKLAKGKFDILLGTQTALKAGFATQFDLVVFPSFDDVAGVPDFLSREISYALLAQAWGALVPTGTVTVQTGNPDDRLIASFQKRSDEDFCIEELKQRKKFAYPPYAKLVKLVCREKSIKKADQEAGRAFGLLAALEDSKIDISEPYEPLVGKKRGLYLRNILIKYQPGGETEELEIAPALKRLGKDWIIDVDPVSTV